MTLGFARSLFGQTLMLEAGLIISRFLHFAAATAHSEPRCIHSTPIKPALSLSLAGDHTTAIPGDAITYTATVMNTGSTLALAGDLLASDTGTATATGRLLREPPQRRPAIPLQCRPQPPAA